MAFSFNTTKELRISDNLIEQVVGQDEAVQIVRKAAQRRRHVLLIGEPGTGKSMLGMALAALLPKEKLVDVVAFLNPNDENQPMIRTVPGGQGRDIVLRSRLSGSGFFRMQNILFFALLFLAFVVPWWALNHYSAINPLLGGIMFMAFFVGGMAVFAAFFLVNNINRRMESKGKVPKVIVDNFNKKQAPFLDATGAHAGALLGDVLHDPFQSLSNSDNLWVVDGKSVPKSVSVNKLIDKKFAEGVHKILKKKEKNYEAVFLDKNELFVLGETSGSVSPVEVLSSNRYVHDGPMIKLSIDGNRELVVTPEHKIAVWRNGKIKYVEAQHIKENDEVAADAKDVIIDEQDIINTYDERQQEQCKLYCQYLEIKAQNPSWGYKRIAKAVGQNIGKTRWWHSGKHIPVPIQTVSWLKERRLLPLKIDNPKLPLIAKVLGATFGDGGIFKNLNGIFLSSSEKEAVEEFGADLEEIFNSSNDENSRIIEGGEYGHSWCYQNTNRKLIRFFLALGAPKGNKTGLELNIPGWISLNERWEDEFFGSFFGGELGTPIIHKKGNHLTSLELGIIGKENYDKNRYEFLSKISLYLSRKSVGCTSIYRKRLDNETTMYRLQIGKKLDNVLNFMTNIKINYCNYKMERLYTALGQWCMLKKNKYHELIERGYGAESAMNLLNLTPQSLYLLLNYFGPKAEATT